jgi:hypothetical protein
MEKTQKSTPHQNPLCFFTELGLVNLQPLTEKIEPKFEGVFE